MAQEDVNSSGGTRSRPDRVAGLVLAVAAILSVALMARHPSVQAHGSDFAAALAEIDREAFTSRLVHGGLMALMGALLFGFWGLADRLDLRRASVRLGAVAYAIGSFSLIGAAVVSGFLVTSLASRFAARPPADLEVARQLLAWSHEANQALAKVGVVATSAAVLFWSLAMIRRDAGARGIGVAGVILGSLTTIAMVAGLLPLNVHGMGLVLLAQALWSVAVGIQLVRRRIGASR